MHSHAIPRILLIGLTLALVAIGTSFAPAAANLANTREWSTTQNYENIFMQGCGDSDVSSNYTTSRHYRQNVDNAGKPIFEFQHVSFTGTVGNVTTERSYAFDGHYVRIADFDQGIATVSDLLLRFEVGTPGMFTISFAQVGFDLVDNPPSVIQAIVPAVVQMDLCHLFGGPTWRAEPWPWARQIAVADEMTPWTELDPCDTAPPGQSC
jgi:hypothetical protein